MKNSKKLWFFKFIDENVKIVKNIFVTQGFLINSFSQRPMQLAMLRCSASQRALAMATGNTWSANAVWFSLFMGLILDRSSFLSLCAKFFNFLENFPVFQNFSYK